MLSLEALKEFVQKEMERPYQPPVYFLSPTTYDWLHDNPETAVRWLGKELPRRVI